MSREKYLNHTYSGNQLAKEYSMDTQGIWEIYGEDPNCDFGGQHREPLLETVRGKLGDVIDYGVTLPGFWQWGAGGRFKRLPTDNIRNVSSNEDKARRVRLAELEARRKEIDREIQNLKTKSVS